MLAVMYPLSANSLSDLTEDILYLPVFSFEVEHGF